MYIHVVQSIQSYRIYRYFATSAKQFCVVNSAVNATWSLVNDTQTILNRKNRIKRENKMNGTQKKKIIDLLFKLPAVKESWILAMLSRDSGHFSNLRRNRNKLTKYRQKSDFSAARNRFVKTFMIYVFW